MKIRRLRTDQHGVATIEMALTGGPVLQTLDGTVRAFDPSKPYLDATL